MTETELSLTTADFTTPSSNTSSTGAPIQYIPSELGSLQQPPSPSTKAPISASTSTLTSQSKTIAGILTITYSSASTPPVPNTSATTAAAEVGLTIVPITTPAYSSSRTTVSNSSVASKAHSLSLSLGGRPSYGGMVGLAIIIGLLLAGVGFAGLG